MPATSLSFQSTKHLTCSPNIAWHLTTLENVPDNDISLSESRLQHQLRWQIRCFQLIWHKTLMKCGQIGVQVLHRCELSWGFLQTRKYFFGSVSKKNGRGLDCGKNYKLTPSMSYTPKMKRIFSSSDPRQHTARPTTKSSNDIVPSPVLSSAANKRSTTRT